MMWQDFKYALRLLSKKPSFTLLTTLVMAIGIGLSVYMFSFFHTILYKDLAFKDGKSLVIVTARLNGSNDAERLNWQDFLAIKESVDGLTEVGGYQNSNVVVTSRNGAIRYPAVLALSNIFELTRTLPAMGRGFTKQEELVGAEDVVVIGHELWQSHFAGEQDVIDKMIRINGKSYRVIGVMPQGYLFPRNAQLWIPLRIDRSQMIRENSTSLLMLAHLKDGFSLADVNRQLAALMDGIARQHPQTNQGINAQVSSIPGVGGAGGGPVIYSMHIVAALILLLASINVGNLLLSRALERSKETAIRVALGAPRSRLIGQMLWESTIICCLGGAIGFLLMAWGLEITQPIVSTFYADPLAFWWDFGIDAYSLKLFFGILLVTIFITGFLPALRSTGGDFNAVLRDGTRGALGKKAGRLNRLLVISEVFISLTVLIASAVMVQSAYEQTRKDMGAETKNTLVAKVLLPEKKYVADAKKIQFIKTFQTQLESHAAISDVMVASTLPGHFSAREKVMIEGREYNKDSNTSYPRANYITTMPGSLKKLGVELRQGRYFNNGDDGLDHTTALVSENFARIHFPGGSALGKKVRLVSENNDDSPWLTIVGVVEQTIQGYRDGNESAIPALYRPLTQTPTIDLSLAMVFNGKPADAVKALRSTLASIDSELASYRIETYQASNDRILAPIVFISSLTALFAMAGVMLAASGIYGVMANTINQRTHEIGIKRALGADEQMVTKEFLISGGMLLMWGGIPGILTGGFMGVAMAQMFGTDTSALVIIVSVMIAIVVSSVLVSTYLPTRKALELEPSQALHYE